MKKNITGLVAIMLGMLLAFGTSGFKDNNQHHNKNTVADEFYFQFMGSHGDESDPTLWKEVDPEDYDDLVCQGSTAGCKIITSSVTGTVPNRHPSSVQVDGNDKPTEGGTTIEARYKNLN